VSSYFSVVPSLSFLFLVQGPAMVRAIGYLMPDRDARGPFFFFLCSFFFVCVWCRGLPWYAPSATSCRTEMPGAISGEHTEPSLPSPPSPVSPILSRTKCAPSIHQSK